MLLRPRRPFCHAGQPGADATAVLPPTDGRLQLLLQPHTGAVAMAVHTQLLPLQVSIPAVDALTAAISAVFGAQPSEREETAKQQKEDQPDGRSMPAGCAESARAASLSPAVVAAAATVIIEDASATLQARRHHNVAPLPPVAAEADSSCSTAAGAGSVSRMQAQCGADDLSAALFTFMHSSSCGSSGNRPEPLQVFTLSGRCREDADGPPRSGGLGSQLGTRLFGSAQPAAQSVKDAARRHAIRFCYPQPREVVLLAVEVGAPCSGRVAEA